MATAWESLPGATGDAWERMCGTSGDAWDRLAGSTGDAWDRLIATCGDVTSTWKNRRRRYVATFMVRRGRI